MNPGMFRLLFLVCYFITFACDVHGQNQDDTSKLRKVFSNEVMDTSRIISKPDVNRDSVSAVNVEYPNIHFKPINEFNPLNQDSAVKNGLTVIKPGISGLITSESYATNYLDPFTPSEKMYSRFYGSPTLTLGNLPFVVDFYFTTEDNRFYNSNSVSVRFDVNRYKQNVQAKARAKLKSIDSAQQLLDERINGLDSVIEQNRQSIALQQVRLGELDTLKGKQPVYDFKGAVILGDSLLGDLPDLVNLTFDSIKIQPDSGVYMGILEQQRLRSEDYQRRKDSLEALMAFQHKLDSIRKNLKSADSNLKAMANNYRQLAGDKKISPDIIGGEKSWPGKIIAQTDHLDIGLIYPYFSELSLAGIPVKGVDYGFTVGSIAFSMVAGKTFVSNFESFGTARPKARFTRNVGGIQYRRKTGKTEFSQSVVMLWDGEKAENLSYPERNIIHTFGITRKMGKKLETGGSLAYSLNPLPSQYEESIEVQAYEPTDMLTNILKNNWAFDGMATYNLTSESRVKSTYRQVQAGFVNLSNPFLRNDYNEWEIQFRQKLFKRNVELESFYKSFRDNVSGFQVTTNRMSGYGIRLKTQFKKLPNLMAQYSPYQQGNNHPDSMYRTRNQLSVYSAVLTYMHRYKTGVLNTMISAINSHMEFSNMEKPVSNEFYNASVAWQSLKISFSVLAYRNQTKPNVDSLNFSGARITVRYKTGKMLEIQSSTFMDYYDSKAFRASTTLLLGIPMGKHFMTSAGIDLGLIRNLYGVDRQKVIGGRVIIAYQFGVK